MSSTDPQSAQALLIPVSLGELIDRISILEIKRQRVTDPRRRANVQRELALLMRALEQSGHAIDDAQMQPLRQVNAVLWELENRIRRLEQEGVLGEEYIAVARDIHLNNDVRHELKRSISLASASLLVEEKEYSAQP